VTRSETEIEIEEEGGLVGVVLIVAAGVIRAVAVTVVGAVTGVAAEAVAGTGAETGHGVEVPGTDETIDQAS
jgi:hypothetical protein